MGKFAENLNFKQTCPTPLKILILCMIYRSPLRNILPLRNYKAEIISVWDDNDNNIYFNMN